MTLSAGLAWAAVVSHEASDLAARTLDTRAAAVQDAAQDEVRRHGDALRLVAAGLASGERVDAAAFETAAAPLDSMTLAGATSLAFLARPVDDAGLGAFAATWRARGSVDLELDPVEAADTHVFAVLSKPLDGSSQRRTGVDLAGAPAALEALTRARESGDVTMSQAYQLIIDQQLPETERQTSFVVTAPVLRQDRLVGWVLMGLRGQDFLGGVVGQAAEGRVDVALSADDTAGESLTVAVAVAGGAGAGPDRRRSITLPVAHQTWTLDVTAGDAALVGDVRHRPAAIRAVSVVIALLVAGLWWSVTSSRARARGEVRAATRDLAAAEATARSQAMLLHTMVETIEEVGVTVVDADGAVLVQSRSARRMLGVDGPADQDAATSDGIGDADGPDRWQQHYGLFALDGSPFPRDEMPLTRALAGEASDGVEMVVRNRARPDGTQIAVSGRPITVGQDRSGALAVFRDVTEERRRQAEQAAFAGMVAHDLKNPLTLVRGLMELVEDGLEDLTGPERTRSTVATHLQMSSAAAGRMAQLIDDLLAYTTADNTTLDVREVALGGLVRDTLVDVVAGHVPGREGDGQAAPRPSVHVGDLPTVACDEERMRQVLGNLIGNALKYVEPGSPAVVEVTAEERRGGGVRILVADRGIGIPEELRAEVVKPFVRAPTTTAGRTSYPGTGLGLAISHRIVERHGGSLRLQANPGGGTVAVVDLPGPTRAADVPVAPQPAQERRPGGPRAEAVSATATRS
ncbi:Fis family transcriptional regulator [Nocardioides dongxiaopingii]|uniref:ATP-binding protein n=1 Tax=Nocardioides sp. S-1144 TaxID=2582905 RepID=UPI00110EBC78|nr:ATP-binding protein [Nocardioides sp. S-1144]QCW51623.1 Fis family transcriptional regulator [Nocardioides sp. S-1144]